MNIITDTREQKPLWTTTKKQALTVGDYTTELLLNKLHIERKSPSDLYGSIIQDHERFRRELLRAKEKNIHLVVFVECTHDDFVNKRFDGGYRLKMKGDTLAKIITTIQARYCEVVWCNGRNDMKTKIRQYLKECELVISTGDAHEPTNNQPTDE